MSARYGGEEDDEQHLGDLAGLEVERSDRHPQPRAVERAADARAAAGAAGSSDAEQRERVAVALEQARVAHEDRAWRRTRPRRPRPRPAWMRARSRSRREIVTKPMPFSTAASGSSVASAPGAKRRTARCATTYRPSTAAEEQPTGRRGSSGSVGERDEDVAATGDDDDEEAERELGAPARAGEDAVRSWRRARRAARR